MSLGFPLITLEEHYVSKAVADYYSCQKIENVLPETNPNIMRMLTDLGETRIRGMNAGRVSLQVISHRPNAIPIPPDVCIAANNELAEAIKANPTRFAGFAILPTNEPDAAATELKRCVQELGFKGSLMDNTTSGRYYDDPFFWPIFRAHEELDVPCYIHPVLEALPQNSKHLGNYSKSVATFLASFGFGWHADTGSHILRLFASKVFDEFPELKIIIGHMGEMLPFQLDRIHRLITRTWTHESRPKRHLMQVWHENIYLTTAGMFSLAPMACVVHTCKADHVLYSVDYPFASNEEGLNFMIQLQDSEMICDTDLENIAYRNAERLLGVNATHLEFKPPSPRRVMKEEMVLSPLESVRE